MKLNDKILVPFSCRVMGDINFMNWCMISIVKCLNSLH